MAFGDCNGMNDFEDDRDELMLMILKSRQLTEHDSWKIEVLGYRAIKHYVRIRRTQSVQADQTFDSTATTVVRSDE